MSGEVDTDPVRMGRTGPAARERRVRTRGQVAYALAVTPSTVLPHQPRGEVAILSFVQRNPAQISLYPVSTQISQYPVSISNETPLRSVSIPFRFE